MTQPAGWYPDPSGAIGQRYWDGTVWTNHLHAGLTERERSEILQQAIMGAHVRVLGQNATQASVMSGEPVNHVVHLLATVLLCGLWLPIWIIIAATGGEKHHTVRVDEWGNVTWLRPGQA